MLNRAHNGGFSLIECMITLAIFFMLMFMAMPSFTSAIQDGQIRTAAQSITSGLHLARAEAIRRNVSVRFRFPNTLDGAGINGGADWQIDADDGKNPAVANYAVPVEARNGKESTENVRVGIKNATDFVTPAGSITAVTDIIFTALGRVSTPARQIDLVHVSNSAARRLSIGLSDGGQIRLCDPKLALANNPQGCV